MIKVLFFAKLREQLGCAELQLTPSEENLNVSCIIERVLGGLGEDKRKYLCADNIVSSVNHEVVHLSYSVKAGDEIAFYPPVTGG